MTAMERPGKGFVWRALTILAALSALTAALADGADAKKKRAFKTGSYMGTTSQGKKAEGLGYDEYPGCPYDFDWEAKLSNGREHTARARLQVGDRVEALVRQTSGGDLPLIKENDSAPSSP